MKRWLMLLVAPAVLLPALGLIALSVVAGGKDQAQPARVASAEFPEFVYYSAKSEQGYRLAVENRQLFALMPCYCGCANIADDPHHNLLDCFLNDDGSFDPHASGCEVCVDIAIDAAQWQAEGRSPSEIHSLVDAKYQGYGPSTSR
jgi:hypothetical protein